MKSFLLALLVSAGSIACSSDDHPAPLAGGAQALPECPGLDTAPCDTRAAACQQRLLELAACLYGVPRAPDVPIRVVSEAELLEEVQAAGSEKGDEAEALENAVHVEQALVELGLVAPGALTDPGGAAAELIERIDGVYQGAERGIRLVDRGRPKDDAEASAVLVHEFVHAIQDDLYDLASLQEQRARDVDGSLALRTVSEGQATYAQFRVIHAMLGYDLSSFDLSQTLDDFRTRVLRSAHEDPSPYLASFATFPYAAGVGSAARAWSPSAPHFARGQFEQPPLTSLAALSESYALELVAAAPRDLPPPEPPSGYTLVDQTRLGAFLLELFLHRQGFDLPRSRALALAWQTDQLWIYAGPEKRTAFLWEIELHDASFAAFDAARPPESGSVREQDGPRLFFAGSATPPEFLLTAGRKFLDGVR